MNVQNPAGKPAIRSTMLEIPEPAISRFLFGDTRMALLWTVIRLYLGYEWLTAGWEIGRAHV